MSDTPETDAAVVDGIDCYGDPLKYWNNFTKHAEVVPAEFSRRLERERDEARRERDDAIEQKNSAFNSIRAAWSLLDHALKEEA